MLYVYGIWICYMYMVYVYGLWSMVMVMVGAAAAAAAAATTTAENGEQNFWTKNVFFENNMFFNEKMTFFLTKKLDFCYKKYFFHMLEHHSEIRLEKLVLKIFSMLRIDSTMLKL